MKRTLVFFIAAVLLLSIPVMAQKGPRGGGKGHHGFGPMMGGPDGDGPMMILRMADTLGLSEQQVDQIQKMNQEFGMENIDRKAALDKAELKMRQLMMDDGTDDQILGMMDEISKLKLDMKKAAFKHHRAILKVLTDDQQAQLKEMRRNFMKMGRRGGMRGDGPGMGPCQGNGPGQGPGRGIGMGNNPDCPLFGAQGN